MSRPISTDRFRQTDASPSVDPSSYDPDPELIAISRGDMNTIAMIFVLCAIAGIMTIIPTIHPHSRSRSNSSLTPFPKPTWQQDAYGRVHLIPVPMMKIVNGVEQSSTMCVNPFADPLMNQLPDPFAESEQLTAIEY